MTVVRADVAARMVTLRERIARSAGDRADEVVLVAVTKSFGPEAIEVAHALGIADIGENYAQELLSKRERIPPGTRVHFIGQLQSNKVRQIAPYVDVYESVDRTALAAEIARRAPGARVLVQVDTSGQPGKGGCPVAEVAPLVDRCRELGLDVLGLMTVGPTGNAPEAARPGFRAVRALVDELGLGVCSMGMSDDLEVALEEGSTEVRVGGALFGSRPPR